MKRKGKHSHVWVSTGVHAFQSVESCSVLLFWMGYNGFPNSLESNSGNFKVFFIRFRPSRCRVVDGTDEFQLLQSALCLYKHVALTLTPTAVNSREPKLDHVKPRQWPCTPSDTVTCRPISRQRPKYAHATIEKILQELFSMWSAPCPLFCNRSLNTFPQKHTMEQ
jgi:hypothetical protein